MSQQLAFGQTPVSPDRWTCARCDRTGYHNKRLCPLFPDLPYPPEEKRPSCICGEHECRGPTYGSGETCPQCRNQTVVEGEGAKRCGVCGWSKRLSSQEPGASSKRYGQRHGTRRRI